MLKAIINSFNGGHPTTKISGPVGLRTGPISVDDLDEDPEVELRSPASAFSHRSSTGNTCPVPSLPIFDVDETEMGGQVLSGIVVKIAFDFNRSTNESIFGGGFQRARDFGVQVGGNSSRQSFVRAEGRLQIHGPISSP
jgi:hypothetical protein